jgi:hypothetical protein
MKKHNTGRTLDCPGEPQVSATEGLDSAWNRVVGRRAFLKGVGVTGAAALVHAALTTSGAMAARTAALTDGDVAILQFLAAAELAAAET